VHEFCLNCIYSEPYMIIVIHCPNYHTSDTALPSHPELKFLHFNTPMVVELTGPGEIGVIRGI
jgi:hypothetical protein